MLYFQTRDTVLDKISIVADDEALLWLSFHHEPVPDAECRDTPVIAEAFRQLEEYLDGKRKIFDLPMKPRGTEFQNRVWNVLKEIPYGKTVSYGDIASQIGNSRAARAVGGAVGANHLPIFIPCHRVIAFDGGLGGYSSGLDIKRALLRLEGADL